MTNLLDTVAENGHFHCEYASAYGSLPWFERK
jgi:hypothetical protein